MHHTIIGYVAELIFYSEAGPVLCVCKGFSILPQLKARRTRESKEQENEIKVELYRKKRDELH